MSGGVKRGQAGGLKSNRRQLHQSELRREPTLTVKLSCAAKVAELVRRHGSRDQVQSSDARALERECGWNWRLQLRKGYESRKSLATQMAQLKIGQYGLRLFGSNLAKNKKQSQSMGCRIRESDKETYQSDVVKEMKRFFEYKRSVGKTVYGAVLRDHYVALLRQAVVRCKCATVELSSRVLLPGLQAHWWSGKWESAQTASCASG